MKINGRVWKVVGRCRSACVNTIIAIAALVSALYFGTFAYYDLMPMSHWVDFQAAKLVFVDGEVRFIRIDRHLYEGEAFIERQTELQANAPEGNTRYCQWNFVPASEKVGRESTFLPFPEMLGPVCDLKQMNGLIVELFITFDLSKPFNVHKRQTFQLGPFQVYHGKLIYRGHMNGHITQRPL